MVVCDICGKGVMIGRLIRHGHSGQWEKRATKNRRIFLPNLHKGKVLIGGVVKNVRACASCLRKYKVSYQRLVRRPMVLETKEMPTGQAEVEVQEPTKNESKPKKKA